jgi:hypothetical protein
VDHSKSGPISPDFEWLKQNGRQAFDNRTKKRLV